PAEADTDMPSGETDLNDGDLDIEVSDPTPAAPTNAIPVPSGTPAAPNAPAGTPRTPEAVENDEAAETQVLVSEVDVVSSNPQRPLTDELTNAVYGAISTVPGRTSTRTQLQQDINSVFSTGFFSNVRAEPSDTPVGVKVTFFVEPNPVLTQVDVRNRQVLPDEVVNDIFASQYGKILNLRDLQNGVLDLNDWYQENGYVLAQVTASPQLTDDGVVTLIAAEGVIEEIEVRFINSDGQTVNEDGEPIEGKTRDFIVTREFETKPGEVFQESAIQQDIGRVFGLGIFDDIRLSLDPGDEDPQKVKMIVNIDERDTGSIGASLGFNLRGDLFGQLSYNEDNFGGNNQKLRTEGRVTTRGDFLFDIGFTDPWIAGDPYRTSYTASLFNRRATSLIFDNGPRDVDLPNGDTPRINRLGTGISFGRPLDNGLSLSLGAQYERVALLDADGDVTPRDEFGNLLTASSNGRDDLLTVQFGAVLDRRNNPAAPTSGSLLRLGTEQSLPLGNGSIFYNKIQGSYSQYVPVNFLGADDGRETIAFNLQGGTTIGELPPYEAFPLGGGNSVRGYEEGAVGSGKSYALGTVEYRFPLFSKFLNGALFADYGTDLGSGDSVPGNPAGVREKPGNGFGYGAGVRVQTPLGALRLDYGLSDEGSRFHFGFGERF
ncbi:MAG: BamA/TamA family outer membrane protein, partial [Phormidesmis sp.]